MTMTNTDARKRRDEGRRQRVYVAGPMRNYPEFNFPAFHAAAHDLIDAGWEVFNPAHYDETVKGFDPDGLTGNENLTALGFDLRSSLAVDMEYITTKADAVAVLLGWESSKGARAKVATALALGLDVFRTDNLELVDDGPTSTRERDTETRITNESGASKGSKLERHDLIPTRPLAALARHYGVGAEKYEPVTRDGRTMDNWRFGYPLSLSYAAMQRHARAFWAGEDVDEETGSSHLSAIAWHAFTMLHFLTEPGYEKFDDRQEAQR